MMLDHLGHPEAAAGVLSAIETVLSRGPRTRDIVVKPRPSRWEVQSRKQSRISSSCSAVGCTSTIINFCVAIIGQEVGDKFFGGSRRLTVLETVSPYQPGLRPIDLLRQTQDPGTEAMPFRNRARLYLVRHVPLVIWIDQKTPSLS